MLEARFARARMLGGTRVSRQRDQGRAIRDRPKLPRDLVTRHAGQVEVEDDPVAAEPFDQARHARAVGCDRDRVPIPTQQDLQRVGAVAMVVHDDDAPRRYARLGRRHHRKARRRGRGQRDDELAAPARSDVVRGHRAAVQLVQAARDRETHPREALVRRHDALVLDGSEYRVEQVRCDPGAVVTDRDSDIPVTARVNPDLDDAVRGAAVRGVVKQLVEHSRQRLRVAAHARTAVFETDVDRHVGLVGERTIGVHRRGDDILDLQREERGPRQFARDVERGCPRPAVAARGVAFAVTAVRFR